MDKINAHAPAFAPWNHDGHSSILRSEFLIHSRVLSALNVFEASTAKVGDPEYHITAHRLI